jgi:hypothetical protein
MAKKSASSMRPLKTRMSAISRRSAAGDDGPRQPPPYLRAVDALAGWLAGRSRPVRMLLAGVIAALITGVIGLVAFDLVFRLPVAGLPRDILFYMVLALAVLGMLFYWVGWRVLVGFDFGTERLRPGYAAVIWLLFGLVVLLAATSAGINAVIEALRD